MQSLDPSNNRVCDFADAECRVPAFNMLIDQQRQFIEEFERTGADLASAKIVLDSLLVSLSLSVRDRHRLRSIFGGCRTEAA